MSEVTAGSAATGWPASGTEWQLTTDGPVADPLAFVRSALGVYFQLAPEPPGRGERVYYDSFDGLLYAAGLTLWLQDGVLRVGRRVNGDEVLRSPLGGVAPSPLHLSDVSDPRMRKGLHDVLGERVALILARAVVDVQPLRVLDELTKTVARIELISAPGVPQRIRVLGLRGYDAELARVQALLSLAAGLTLTSEPLVDSVARAAGANPAGTSSAISVQMQYSEPAQVAVARVLSALGAIYDANLPGTLTNLDIEFLHDLRVTLRRTRSVVRELHGVLPDERYRQLRTQLRWLQQVTGPSRDLDVQLEEFCDLPGLIVAPLRGQLAPLERVLRAQQRRAREQMEAELRGPGVAAVMADWHQVASGLVELPIAGRVDALVPIGDLAGRRILSLHRRMVKMGRAINSDSPPDDYHELRKQGKELRYLLEIFGRPLFPAVVISPLITALKGLQDVLGRHQDREVQAQTLAALAPQVVGEPGGTGAVLAMGALIQRFESDAAKARGEFRSQFEVFSARTQRELVSTTFKAAGSE